MSATPQMELPSADEYLAMMVANNWLEMGYSTVVEYLARHTRPPARILDLGCGPGIFTRYLADTFAAEALGVDPSDDMIAVANRNFAADRVLFRAGRPEEILRPLASQFDIVVSCFVLMHLPEADSHRQLAECARSALRPGGQAVFLDMNPASVGVQFASVRNGEPDVTYASGDPMVTTVSTPNGPLHVHDRFWSAAHYRQAIESAGFSVLEQFTLPPPSHDGTPADQFTVLIAEKK